MPFFSTMKSPRPGISRWFIREPSSLTAVLFFSSCKPAGSLSLHTHWLPAAPPSSCWAGLAADFFTNLLPSFLRFVYVASHLLTYLRQSPVCPHHHHLASVPKPSKQVKRNPPQVIQHMTGRFPIFYNLLRQAWFTQSWNTNTLGGSDQYGLLFQIHLLLPLLLPAPCSVQHARKGNVSPSKKCIWCALFPGVMQCLI